MIQLGSQRHSWIWRTTTQMTAADLYLTFYSAFNAAVWGYIFVNALTTTSSGNDFRDTMHLSWWCRIQGLLFSSSNVCLSVPICADGSLYDKVGHLMEYIQLISLLEVVHAVVKLTPSSPLAAFMQVQERDVGGAFGFPHDVSNASMRPASCRDHKHAMWTRLVPVISTFCGWLPEVLRPPI